MFSSHFFSISNFVSNICQRKLITRRNFLRISKCCCNTAIWRYLEDRKVSDFFFFLWKLFFHVQQKFSSKFSHISSILYHDFVAKPSIITSFANMAKEGIPMNLKLLCIAFERRWQGYMKCGNGLESRKSWNSFHRSVNIEWNWSNCSVKNLRGFGMRERFAGWQAPRSYFPCYHRMGLAISILTFSISFSTCGYTEICRLDISLDLTLTLWFCFSLLLFRFYFDPEREMLFEIENIDMRRRSEEKKNWTNFAFSTSWLCER